MNYAHVTLESFCEVSLSEKTKAIEKWGTPLVMTDVHGLRFFLYWIHDYFAEVITNLDTMEVIDIKASRSSRVLDLYLSTIDIGGLYSGGKGFQ